MNNFVYLKELYVKSRKLVQCWKNIAETYKTNKEFISRI